MKTFKYGIIMEFFYKFGNIPVSLLLIIHFFYILLGFTQNTYMIFPIIIYLIILYLINRQYFKVYKVFPFRIEINNEKMICKDFLIGKDKEIVLGKISKIEGSIFGGNAVKPLYIFDESGENKIGIYLSMKEFDKLLTIILSNVKKDLYEDLVQKVKMPKGKNKK